MATLDTALLIQPAVTRIPTTAMQAKPAEGFQQLLDDQTYKASHPAPQPKPTVVGSRPARAASQPAKDLQPVSRGPRETKTQPSRDANDARLAVKPEAGSAKARSEAPAKVAQRRAAIQGSQRDATDGLTEAEAESTQRQDLPSEMAEEASEPSVLAPEETGAKTTENEVPVAVAQTASAAALLASLLVQTTGELKGTQRAVEAEPQVAEPAAAAGLPTLPAAASAGTASTGTEAWMSSATPISPEGFVSTEVAGDASVAATVPAGTASTGTEAWMSSASPIFPEVHAGTPLSADALGGKADSVATVPDSASQELPETAVPSNSVSASPKVGVPSESSVSELAASESAIFAANGQAATAAQPEWVTQSIAQTAVAESTPLATTEQPAVAGKAEKIIKSRQEFVVAAGPAGAEVRLELLTSRSLSQQEAETAAGDTPPQDASYSKQPEAKPEGPEIVHNLKAAVIPNKEIPWAQPEVHTEIQEAKGNVAHQAAELASLPENQGTATKAPHEVAFNMVAGTETASSVVSAPELTATAGLTAATGKVVGTSHANVDWSQVEKAQVVSQIVERAHLLGKNQSELMVVLKPEFLGKVNLHAAMVDNQLVATIMAESASVKQMLESQLSSLQTALHEQGFPVAKVEVVQGSQLSFADLGAGQSSSQQHLESGKSELPPSLSRYETSEDSAEVVPLEAHIYAPPTSRSLNLVA